MFLWMVEAQVWKLKAKSFKPIICHHCLGNALANTPLHLNWLPRVQVKGALVTRVQMISPYAEGLQALKCME